MILKEIDAETVDNIDTDIDAMMPYLRKIANK